MAVVVKIHAVDGTIAFEASFVINRRYKLRWTQSAVKFITKRKRCIMVLYVPILVICMNVIIKYLSYFFLNTRFFSSENSRHNLTFLWHLLICFELNLGMRHLGVSDKNKLLRLELNNTLCPIILILCNECNNKIYI